MDEPDAAAVARRALPLLDLTDLTETCTEPKIDALCRDARSGGVAAICVWPHFVAQGARALKGSGIRVATVINFPAGGEDCARATDDTAEALRDGADEIDLVLPYRAFLHGDAETARDMVEAVRDTCGAAILKVILETGELADPDVIRRAGRLALEAGADFLKTSTGKSPVSATPEAAESMLIEIQASARPAGLKISGGLRSVADAATYLALADRIMGPDWVGPKTFRLGASSLFGALMQARES
ncbi:2-deoxyribose-5-phosphate aldolase [Methylobacterium sp. GXS13]|uniref:deoxyribose-phosphate aldolase n=1 Tax=Methylobacterium sp. GXS13 TaxID=1730094 RepID=UPI00071B98EC|nr:deoxyribose-phosphate aldolase [Methylobacterium sp. GXS13]KST59907.1 2-deoxyribose-5-phosphate aldolase [Methylobacterium sp. GXS13]